MTLLINPLLANNALGYPIEKTPSRYLHRSVKYLKSRIEADYAKLRPLIKRILGFKAMKTAHAAIKGFEVMHMFQKGQSNAWISEKNIMGEIHLMSIL